MIKFNKKTGGKTFLFAIILDIGVQIVLSVVLSGIVLSGGYSAAGEIPGYSTINLAAMLILQGAFVVALIVHKPQLFPTQKRSFARVAADALIAIAIAFVCLCCFSWAGEWFSVLLDAIGYKASGLEINGAVDLVLCVTATVIVAPVVEETLFRGVMTNEYSRRHGEAVTVLLSGLSFALMHMNPAQTVYQFMLGCACAYMLIKTRDFIVPVVVHATGNAAAIALNYVDWEIIKPQEGRVSVLLNNPALSVPITLLLAAAGAAIIYFTGKALGKKQAAVSFNYDKGGEGKISCGFAIGICAVMWIVGLISGCMA